MQGEYGGHYKMISREEMKEYALKICVPLMERTLKRERHGETAFKADQVGFVPSILENFCRPFWGIAPIIASGEDITLSVDGESVSVLEYMKGTLKRGLSHGEESSWDRFYECFGAYAYENQNITELAGLMIGIFFAREQLWEPLAKEEKDMIAKELYKMAEVAFDHSWPNNHYWFPLFTFTVLKRLGYTFERTEEMLDYGLNFLDSLYIGDGWYKDGEFGRFDYYEAWSLHLYPLLWTLIADSSFKDYDARRKSYIERTEQFLKMYAFWFDKNGANVPFGRSLSYRFAASAVFPVAYLAGCNVEPELAGRITSANVEFFMKNVKAEGTDILPEGYIYHSPDVVEGYTSDGGAYWACKTFLAILIEEDSPFWNYEKAQLPAEKGDFLAVPENKKIHMLFEGKDGLVTMYNNTAQYYLNGMKTHKFGNMCCWYSKFAYNSAAGFGCSSADNVASDCMISLMTPDNAMTSHRLGFEDLGYEDGVLHSRHIPFPNDKDTVIESFMLPLGGINVRVHRVKLSQPYYVLEGGFSLARWDDYKPVSIGDDFVAVSNHTYTSVIKAVSDAEIQFRVDAPQAGFHIYAPLASYPIYITSKPLESGEYVFASASAVTEDNNITLPDIRLLENKVEIIYGDTVKKIMLEA